MAETRRWTPAELAVAARDDLTLPEAVAMLDGRSYQAVNRQRIRLRRQTRSAPPPGQVTTSAAAELLGLSVHRVQLVMRSNGRQPSRPAAGARPNWWWLDDVLWVRDNRARQGEGGGGGHTGQRAVWCRDKNGRWGGPHRMAETRDKHGRCSACATARAAAWNREHKPAKGT